MKTPYALQPRREVHFSQKERVGRGKERGGGSIYLSAVVVEGILAEEEFQDPPYETHLLVETVSSFPVEQKRESSQWNREQQQ